MAGISRGRRAFYPVRDEMTAAWIDISVPIYPRMVYWPGDPAVRIELVHDLSRGDAANVSKLELGAHTGTHMDARCGISLRMVRGSMNCPSTPRLGRRA